MAIQQPVQTFTPNEVAELAGIAAHNVRRWAEYHAMHLSDSAKPPTGMARRFTSRDIEVLKHVDSLRQLGLTVPVINEQLKEITFAEIEQPTDIATTLQQDTAIAPQDAPDAPGRAENTLAVYSHQQAQIEALRTDFDVLQASQRDRWWWWVAGLVCGLGLAAVAELFALLASRVR
jgi:DNA-binding transcriptional MerR regulator